jgi:hypothetical protein
VGVTIIKPIEATEWGTKGFYAEDPDGYIIRLRRPPGRWLTTGCTRRETDIHRTHKGEVP